ncbi:GNAT family N-acetyltransferase [Lacibacter sp. MH-610]|uniref:GNAT family N-acetyltransferase n=1 Tax=Lacibacter sp. MH-610 TaxID=3020883 RepID=UPI0038920F0B
MLVTKTVETDEELMQILELQQLYLAGHTSWQEEQEQGFVTVEHNLEKLKILHALSPSVIVKDDSRVIAYALVLMPEAGGIFPELVSLFQMLQQLNYHGQPLYTHRFYVMGQICIHKNYRGRGVFELLYQKHKELLQAQYDFVVTSVATRNTRSIRAHEKTGFKTIHHFMDDHEDWLVILWDWNEPDADAP